MTTRRLGATLRRTALLAATGAMLAACSDLVENESLGSRPDPAGGSTFRTYMALGTSLGAGFESGGINDSTQRESYAAVLAQAMGLTPGADWAYPSFRFPGCPAPYSNILTTTRVGGASSTGCAFRDPASAAAVLNNLSIPGARLRHLLSLTDTVGFGLGGTLGLAQLITGSINPIDWVERVSPTFVTLEIGANDVLGAATTGNTAQLTPLATFQAQYTELADRVDASGALVAASNVPNVTRIPHFTRGSTLWCLNTGLCGIPATPPFNSPLFTVDVSCAPAAAGGVGDNYLLAFPATAAITATLAAGGPAALNCATDVATAGANPAGPTLNVAETAEVTQRVADLNTFILAEANARGWAHVNLDSALGSAAVAAQIPPIPGFSTPSTLMGPLFSLDGVHPNRAGYRMMARVFRDAINAEFGTNVAAIN